MSTANCRRSRSPSSCTPKASATFFWCRKIPTPIRLPTPRQVKGASAIVFVQTCAAEKRRRRKRGTLEDPQRRVVINSAVCEGCGDCSVQSNCISVEPLETELGRKRTINQSSCNKDFSCVKGFCPSFVTVDGGALRKRVPVDLGTIGTLP